MNILKFYNAYEEAYFLERPNRFVMVLQTKTGSIIHTHVPNTGRMEEFCLPQHPFFISPQKHRKFSFKVVATTYQNNVVFLDTVKVNEIFSQLLNHNLIPQFHNTRHVKREVTFGNSRFDFTFMHNHTNVIVEVKSCTLCHNRLAMFPDAPTLRGQKHLAILEQLAVGENPPLALSGGENTPLPPSRRDYSRPLPEGEYKTYVIFLILNASAERFMPNFHTDFDYGTLFLAAKAVNFKAFKLRFIDPVSVDLQSIQEVPIDFSTTRTHCQNKGSYLLVLENPEDITITVGKLGDIHFQKGWYVYVGSALQALDSRVKRHQRRRKKLFWHIDYIASTVMKVKKVYPIRRLDRIESELAHALENISDGAIKHFGTSDSRDFSHLFYFHASPLKHRDFVDIIFDARTF